eukprot:CAMPEP_0179201038 /NCGR_PEP_ID=MMETSP0796-20121207/100053_1 /TAXON_ID=73915 /ORGANISM="Pyrodinium bahamense, Strain pbaha01" /LENGTH=47 /DNA_ID= /DNA_START= /DNA_END= /DNA_ORIENTATION=
MGLASRGAPPHCRRVVRREMDERVLHFENLGVEERWQARGITSSAGT